MYIYRLSVSEIRPQDSKIHTLGDITMFDDGHIDTRRYNLVIETLKSVVAETMKINQEEK